MNNIFSSRLVLLLARYQHYLLLVLCTMILAFGVFSGASTAYAATYQSGQAMHLASDYPTRYWSLSFSSPGGLSASATGSITFYNRSVGISGKLAPSSNACIRVRFEIYSILAFWPEYSCTNETSTIDYFSVPVNQRGGASDVVVTLENATLNGVSDVGTQTCTRNGRCM
jgi:hypothetical protein